MPPEDAVARREPSGLNRTQLTADSCTSGGVTGALVEYDSIHGTSPTAAGNLQAALYSTNYSDGANAVMIDHVDFYNGQRILHGPGTVQNSFCLDNVSVSGAHYECIYEGGGSITINHNTLLTAFTQTAAIFLSTDFAALDRDMGVEDELAALKANSPSAAESASVATTATVPAAGGSDIEDELAALKGQSR